MKRPEGFDSSHEPRSATPRGNSQPHITDSVSSRGVAPRGVAPRGVAPRGGAPRRTPSRTANRVQPTEPFSPRDLRRAVRQAARDRRAVERGEIKRFTRRTRTRRIMWGGFFAFVTVLLGLLAVAVFSPLLSLSEITVEGADRVDAAEVRTSVESQLGTPLALLDFDLIEKQLGDFALIRSFVTRTVPPDTLVIRIVEREPLGVVDSDAGFDTVDAAGIVLASSVERPEGLPLIRMVSVDADGEVFGAISEVLLSLPSSLLAEVESIAATTRDDVTFVLRGVGHSVVWGSADSSAFKARVLATMLGSTASTVRSEFDVSAPESIVVTPK